MQFRTSFLFPVLVIIVSSVAALVGGLFWLTALQNRTEDSHERARVTAAFTARVEAIAATTRVFSVWDDAAENLLGAVNRRWADDQESGYVLNQYDIEATFVIDAAGRALYGSVEGKRTDAEPDSILGPGYITAVRSILAARPVPAEPVSGVSIASRGPVIFGISRIRPHSAGVPLPPGPARFLVMAKGIDRQMVGEVAKLAATPGLSFGRPGDEGAGRWTLISKAGNRAGLFTWTPARPGTELRRATLPRLLVLIACMLVLAFLVLLRARQGARELVANELKANYVAAHDALTGLPNRRAFTDMLLEPSRRKAGYFLLYMDLDGFKEVNDSFGHSVGDKVLRRTSERLQRVVGDAGSLSRLGGDEFALIVDKIEQSAVEQLAQALIEAVRVPLEFGSGPTTIGVSIGIARSAGQGHDDIIRQADAAMYAAKTAGRNQWIVYHPDLLAERSERKSLESDLRQAIAQRNIRLVYQPIVRVSDGRTVAVEALARWTHPEKGEISPDVFIPIAEESGLIVELGEYILEEACIAARDWPFDLSVNLSTAQFWNRNLADSVKSTLERCQFPAERLELEITETYLLRRPDAAARVITSLRRAGVRIALDDFGTGFASIAYLRKFEFDRVKIDRSLVEQVAQNSAAADVMSAIIALCRALALPILAEGVENREQAALLAAAGCTHLQGWHFGYPMSSEAMNASLHSDRYQAAS